MEKTALARELVGRFGGKYSDTQVKRWEAGQQIKLADAVRVATILPGFRVNLIAILRAAATSGSDPGFAAWAEFRRTPEGKALDGDPDLLESLVFFPWTEGSDPSVGDYLHALSTLKSARRTAK